jgi:dTDP-glucose pyrophosphorylase
MFQVKYSTAKNNIVKYNLSILNAIKLLNKITFKILLVIDKNNKLIGTITDGDIRRGLIHDEKLNSKCIDIMNNKPKCVTNKDEDKILDALQKYSFPIPLLDKKKNIVSLCTITKHIKNYNNTVVIMAGGKGERLMPLTKNTAKPMLLVNKKPIIHGIINNIKSCGFTNIVISVNYLAKQLIDYFGSGEKFGVNIDYIIEKKPLGTAGSLSLLDSGLKGPIIVLNGDVLTNLNFRKLLEFHKKTKMLITMCVAKYSISIPYGTIKSKGLKIINIIEKPTENYLVNAGIYVIEKSVFNNLNQDTKLDMTELIEKFLKKKKVNAYPLYEDWTDIGNMEDYRKIKSKVET